MASLRQNCMLYLQNDVGEAQEPNDELTVNLLETDDD
jgi:hypothetical protein